MTPSPSHPLSALTRHELDTAEVLTALRALAGRAASPVVRECLEVAHAEIAFLGGAGQEHEEDEGADDDPEPSAVP
jgi:hypothetical protein